MQALRTRIGSMQLHARGRRTPSEEAQGAANSTQSCAQDARSEVAARRQSSGVQSASAGGSGLREAPGVAGLPEDRAIQSPARPAGAAGTTPADD